MSAAPRKVKVNVPAVALAALLEVMKTQETKSPELRAKQERLLRVLAARRKPV